MGKHEKLAPEVVMAAGPANVASCASTWNVLEQTELGPVAFHCTDEFVALKHFS